MLSGGFPRRKRTNGSRREDAACAAARRGSALVRGVVLLALGGSSLVMACASASAPPPHALRLPAPPVATDTSRTMPLPSSSSPRSAEATGPAEPDPFPVLHDEAIGPFTAGMSEDEAVRRAPALRALGPVVEEGATGEWVQFFEDHARTIAFGFASVTEHGPREVRSVQAFGASRLRTKRGVGIGAPYASVIAAYGDVLDKDFPPTDRSVIVGSLYGGLIFHFEQGVVTEIFLGPGAE